MKKIILINLLGVLFSLDAITEYHNNGMPKVVKIYAESSKLELDREIGYYSNGFKEYQINYYKGEILDTQRWDENGIKIEKGQYEIISMRMIDLTFDLFNRMSLAKDKKSAQDLLFYAESVLIPEMEKNVSKLLLIDTPSNAEFDRVQKILDKIEIEFQESGIMEEIYRDIEDEQVFIIFDEIFIKFESTTHELPEGY